jgi:GNAT superfamily N-acetyltransferase
MEPRLRVARPDDAEAIDALMKASIRDLFPAYYDVRQTASAIEHVGSVDRTLLTDGTYFVIEEDGEGIIACGGWSRRHKLYTGSGDAEDDDRLLDPATEAAHVRAMFVRGDRTRRGLRTLILEACEAAARREGFRELSLSATLPGIPLYARFGFVAVQPMRVRMPDGVEIDAVEMVRPIQ